MKSYSDHTATSSEIQGVQTAMSELDARQSADIKQLQVAVIVLAVVEAVHVLVDIASRFV